MAENKITTKLEYLFQIEPPWIYVGSGEEVRKQWIPSAFYSRSGLNVCVRRLRGWKMRTTQSLMDEFGASLQFFDGFGENWLALLDCLQYLDEWLPADAYILLVERAEEVLIEEDMEQMRLFLMTLRDAGEWWSNPIVDNERFNRSAIPFHTLLHTSDGMSRHTDRILQVARGLDITIRSNISF